MQEPLRDREEGGKIPRLSCPKITLPVNASYADVLWNWLQLTRRFAVICVMLVNVKLALYCIPFTCCLDFLLEAES